MILLSEHAELMQLLHPDYPTPIPAVNEMYEDHMLKVIDYFETRLDAGSSDG